MIGLERPNIIPNSIAIVPKQIMYFENVPLQKSFFDSLLYTNFQIITLLGVMSMISMMHAVMRFIPFVLIYLYKNMRKLKDSFILNLEHNHFSRSIERRKVSVKKDRGPWGSESVRP
ncbi:hypothetical protein ACH5RR_040528 [Cinchona calisaya]|uniref:Uncharacterized protein n=1 Tax=Cinchona calisaya TaxID=153742 RepID=A0ABD2XRY9_9GENT